MFIIFGTVLNVFVDLNFWICYYLQNLLSLLYYFLRYQLF